MTRESTNGCPFSKDDRKSPKKKDNRERGNGAEKRMLETLNKKIRSYMDIDGTSNEICDTDKMYEEKKKLIQNTLDTNPPDVQTKLREFAISSGGFVTDELRQRAWPKMLDVDVNNIPPKPGPEVLQGHRDYNQVVLDVNRSLKRFPPGMDEDVRLGLQDQLVDLIMRVLVRHEELHYYQGYHDICVTFLLVVGEDLAFALVDKLSLNHLRDFMDANMDRTKRMLNYLYPLLERVNPELQEFMERSEVGTIFSLSWLITWYGHVLPDLRDIVRCYDFFIACHPLMPIYLAGAIVIYRQTEILSSECEMCVLHSLLSKIPDDLPYEKLMVEAGKLYDKHSPDELAHDAILHFKRSQRVVQDRIQNNYSRKRRVPVGKRRYTTIFSFDGHNICIKVTLWTFIAVFSAAAIAYLNSSYYEDLEWEWWSPFR